MALTKIGIDAISGAIGTTQLEDNAVTTGKIAAGAVGNTDIASSAVTVAKTGFSSETSAITVPKGTTGERPSAVAGQLRFNTSLSLMEYYDGSTWKPIDSPPVVTSISPSAIASSSSSFNIVITGSNFQSGAIVKAIGQDLTEVTAGTVVVDSSTQITATFNGTSFADAQEDYDIKVTNTSGLSGTGDNILAVNATPVWTVASGSLGSIADTSRTSVSITTGATDSEGTSLTYALASGSLPSGLSLNTSTGAITGNATAVTSDTTSSFTLSATDGINTTTRAYSITVQAPALFLTVLTGITNAAGYTLNSANASPIFILDPADTNCDNGSSSTLTQLGSGAYPKNGTLNGMTRGGTNKGKYWEFAGGSTSDIDFGTSQNGYTNDSTDIWAYCGWWYMATNPATSGGDQVVCLNDGDWSPNSQVGVRYGYSSSSNWYISSGGSGNFYAGAIRGDINPGDWMFLCVWHKVSGGLFVADAKSTSTDLNVYVNNSTASSTGNVAAGIPLTLGSRPDDRAANRTTNGYRMGAQAFWAITSSSMSSSQSDAASMFETIFDRTKSRYL